MNEIVIDSEKELVEKVNVNYVIDHHEKDHYDDVKEYGHNANEHLVHSLPTILNDISMIKRSSISNLPEHW